MKLPENFYGFFEEFIANRKAMGDYQDNACIKESLGLTTNMLNKLLAKSKEHFRNKTIEKLCEKVGYDYVEIERFNEKKEDIKLRDSHGLSLRYCPKEKIFIGGWANKEEIKEPTLRAFFSAARKKIAKKKLT